MSPDCTSELSNTVKMFIPLSELLGKVASNLENSHTWPISRADSMALSFVTWCVDKLNAAKETANTAKRHTTLASNHYQGVDFASTNTQANPTSHSDATAPPRDRRNARQITMAYNAARGQNRGHGQHMNNQGSTMQFNANAAPPRSAERLPGLREARKLPFPQKKAWLDQAMASSIVPQWIKDIYAFEVANPNAPNTIHALSSACRKNISYFVPYTPVAVGLFYLESHFIHNKRVCGYCPSTMSDTDRYHKIKDCKTAQAAAPVEHAAFASAPESRDKSLMGVAPAADLPPPPPPPAPTAGAGQAPSTGHPRNRKRYDDSPQTPNKRARPQPGSQHHIR